MLCTQCPFQAGTRPNVMWCSFLPPSLGHMTHHWSPFCRLLAETRNESSSALALSLQPPSSPYTPCLPSTTRDLFGGMYPTTVHPRGGAILSEGGWVNFVLARMRVGKRGALLWLMAGRAANHLALRVRATASKLVGVALCSDRNQTIAEHGTTATSLAFWGRERNHELGSFHGSLEELL